PRETPASRATRSNVEPAMPRSATLARMASTIRAAFSEGRSPASERSGAVAACIQGDSTAHGVPTADVCHLKRHSRAYFALRGSGAGPGREKGARWAPSRKVWLYAWPLGRGDGTRRRRRGRADRRRVLELLLGAEQGVQHLGAQALRNRQRDDRADQQDHELAAEPALLLLLGLGVLGRVRERHGGVAARLERRSKLALQLLVVDQSPLRGLGAAQAVGRALTGLDCRPHVVAQLGVLEQALDVRVGLRDVGQVGGIERHRLGDFLSS